MFLTISVVRCAVRVLEFGNSFTQRIITWYELKILPYHLKQNSDILPARQRFGWGKVARRTTYVVYRVLCLTALGGLQLETGYEIAEAT